MCCGWNSVNFLWRWTFKWCRTDPFIKMFVPFQSSSLPETFKDTPVTRHLELHGFGPDILHLPFFLCLCKLKTTFYSISLSISGSLPPLLTLLLSDFKCAVVKIWPQKKWFCFPCWLCVGKSLPSWTIKEFSPSSSIHPDKTLKCIQGRLLCEVTLSFRKWYQLCFILFAAVFISTKQWNSFKYNNMFHMLSKIIYTYDGSEFI